MISFILCFIFFLAILFRVCILVSPENPLNFFKRFYCSHIFTVENDEIYKKYIAGNECIHINQFECYNCRKILKNTCEECNKILPWESDKERYSFLPCYDKSWCKCKIKKEG